VARVARRLAELGGTVELAWARPGRRTADGRLADVELGDGRRLAGDRFVFACGPWLPRVFPDVAADLVRVTKQDVCFVGPAGGDGRFDANELPCWVDYDASYYGIPAVDGRGMKIAPDRYGPVFDPSAGERLIDPDTVRLARTYLARRFPDLAGAPIVETRVCQYETTPDTHFVIDLHPALENAWLVGGGSGHGFKHGPVIGRYVTELLGGREPSADEARFAIGPRTAGEAGGMRTGADLIVAGWDGY
jgi:glycine/D-amino acid oxidase-like deaminating enzyme